MESIRLLLVDDETDFRAPLKKRLQKKGFFVLEAENGDRCRAVMEKEPVDVVILDVKMPGMNGLEVLRWIRDRFPGTEAILLTGHASTADGVEGIKKGAFDYLTKPVDFEHLTQKIIQAAEKTKHEKTKQEEAEFRHRMTQQLAAAQRLASLGTLSTGITREIERPLSVIIECTEYLRLMMGRAENTAIPWKKEIDIIISKMEAASDRIGRIVHPLLGFTRQTETVTEQTNLKSLVSVCVKSALEQAKGKNIDIVLDLDRAEGVIWSDPDDVRQIIGNLIANAITAVESDGTITVELTDTDAGVRLSVKDDGCGISGDDLEKVFEPFFTTRPEESPGLGLYVTSVIVDRLGGNIAVSSRVKQGTVFQLTLPRIREN
ncbi:MAG: response regulator [Thermodesulfobacteriota bacterium]